MAAIIKISVAFLLSNFIMQGILVSASRTDAAKAIKCYNDMNEENDILRLLLGVKSRKQIESFCKRMSNWMKCIAENEDNLDTAENTSYLRLTSGIHQFWLNVCPPGTDLTESYKSHASCFELVRYQMRSCALRVPSNDDPEMQNVHARCCILQEYRRCMSSAVSVRCGEDAANVTTQIMQRYHKTFMGECENDKTFGCEGGRFFTRTYPGSSTKGLWLNNDQTSITLTETEDSKPMTSRSWYGKDYQKKKDKKAWKEDTNSSMYHSPLTIFIYIILCTISILIY